MADPEATGEQIRQVWQRASIAAMEQHRRTGVPVATWDWENGRVLLIPADEIPIPDEDSLAIGNPPGQKV